MEALEDIPEVEKPLLTEKGEAKLQKTDIFRKIMWFGYENENSWHPVPAPRVAEIITLNEKGEKPYSLLENNETNNLEEAQLNSDLVKMDKKFTQKTKKKKKKRQSRKRGKNRPQ